MPVVLSAAPAEIGDLVIERLLSLPPASGQEPGGDDDGLEIYRPVPVFSIDKDTLAHLDGDRDLAARHIGWWVLVGEGDDLTVVDVPATEGALRVGLVLRGQLGSQFAEATTVVEESLGGEGIWEARVLDLREVGVTALWLHSDVAESFAVPLWEEAVPLQPLREFLEVARQRARVALGL